MSEREMKRDCRHSNCHQRGHGSHTQHTHYDMHVQGSMRGTSPIHFLTCEKGRGPQRATTKVDYGSDRMALFVRQDLHSYFENLKSRQGQVLTRRKLNCQVFSAQVLQDK